MKHASLLFLLLSAAPAFGEFALPTFKPAPISPAARLVKQAQRPAPPKQILVGSTALPMATPTSSTNAPIELQAAAAQPAKKAALDALATKGVNPGAVKGDGFGQAKASGGGNSRGSQAFNYNSGAGNSGGTSGGGGGGTTSQGSGGEGPKKPIVAFPKWYPMCVFMDNSVRNGNEVVKGLVDMAAKCQVNLVVFPFYSKNMPGDGNGVKDAARDKCNAEDGFRQSGVNRATSLVLTGNRSLPATICQAPSGADSNICGEMGWDPGEGVEQRMRSTGRWSGAAPPGKAAVGVVAPGPSGFFNIADVAAVTGQTFLNRPPGYAGGNGVGDANEGQSAGGVGAKQGWSDSGCDAMRQASFANDGRWKYSADQKDYVVKGDDEKRFLDLKSDKTVFSKPRPAGKANKGDADGGKGGGGSGSEVAGSSRGDGGGRSGGSSGGGGRGGTSNGSSPFAFRKNSEGGSASGGGGRTTSASDSVYSAATGGPDSTPNSSGLAEVAPIQPDDPAGAPGVPGVIALNGQKSGAGAGQNTGYDEAAKRTGSALGGAATFFGGGTVAKSAEKKESSLDGDFFKKLFQSDDEQASWRRKSGGALRKSAVAAEGDSAARADRASEKREPSNKSAAPGDTSERVVERGGNKSDSRKASRAPASAPAESAD